MPTIVPIDLPASYWREKAQRAQRAGQHTEAVRLYRAAMRKREDNALRRELAQVLSDMRSYALSNRLYLENLALDAQDSDSLYGLARNYSLLGDENGMADLLDLYLRMAPCGEQADTARDILWRMPRTTPEKGGDRRARTLYFQALDRFHNLPEAMQLAKKSWQRGRLPETAQLLSELYLRQGKGEKARAYALYACENNPEEMNARLLLAGAMQACNMPSGCRAALRQAQQMCKTYDQTTIFCRQALLLGCGDLALELMEQRAEQTPGSTETLLMLVLVLRSLGQDEERVQRLLQTVIALDEDDILAQTLQETVPETGESDAAFSVRMFERMGARLSMSDTAREDEEAFYHELRRVLRMPLPGLREALVGMLIKIGHVRGLRLALVQDDMPYPLCEMIVHALEALGASMPCFARVEGRVCLLPPRERPPYDENLHALIRALLRDVKGEVPLATIAKETPRLWRSLPESARRHYAKEEDGVWRGAFAAYMHLCAGNAEKAEARIAASSRPLRTGRAFMQLIRRSKTNEVH